MSPLICCLTSECRLTARWLPQLRRMGHTDAGELCVCAESVSFKVGQRLGREGGQEIWHSVGVYAKQEEDGTLVVQVLVFNPDWDEALQIASIKSRPHDGGCDTALGCNL